MQGQRLTRRGFIAASAGFAVFTPAVAKAAQKVTLGIVNTISDAPYFIAHARGYFKTEGLDVDIANFPSGAKMIASLTNGELDVSGGAISAGLYNANERQFSIKIVADKARNAPGYGFKSLLVRADLVDGGAFKTLADLTGRRCAIPAIGSVGEQSLMNECCKRGGIAFNEVERVYLAVSDQFAALANKAIDATIVSEPTVSLAEKRGVGRRFITLDKIYPNQQAAVTTYGAEFLKKRDAAVAFMRAFLRGARDYNDALKDGRIAGKDVDNVVGIIAKYSMVKDTDLLRNVVPSACNPDGEPNVEGMQKDLSFVQSLGLAEKQATVAKVLDLSFLKAALIDLGPYKRG